jgi:hypothetical protein
MGWGMKSGIHAEYSGCDVSAGGRVSAGIFFAFFFNRGFARVSPVFAVAFLSAALAAYVLPPIIREIHQERRRPIRALRSGGKQRVRNSRTRKSNAPH